MVISKLPTAKCGKKFLGKPSNMGNRPLTFTEKKSLLSQSEDPEKGSDIKMEQVIEDCQIQIDDTSYGDFLLNQGADDDNKPIIIEPQSDSVHKITDTEKPRTAGKVETKEPLKIKETLVLSEHADNIPGSELLIDSLNKYISSDDITESMRRIERLRNIS